MKKTLLALGIASVSSLMATSAFAQSIVSGSSTIVLMNGASQSVGAELQISDSLTFLGGDSVNLAGTIDGGVVVTPELTASGGSPFARLARNNQDFEELVVDAGLPDASIVSTTPTTFTAAAAAALLGKTVLADQVSIIRAGAGVDGLD